jgi:hypothetical protein
MNLIVSELASEARPAALKLGEDEAQLFEATPEESSIAGEECIGMNLGVGVNQEGSRDIFMTAAACVPGAAR